MSFLAQHTTTTTTVSTLLRLLAFLKLHEPQATAHETFIDSSTTSLSTNFDRLQFIQH